ncbi:TVP38/TMEM64 family protein [Vreelandella nigrificans]|uniref:TVP38/TMEM64 family membrane protein n=1 Tax=Vreelandella nigrificans TaxID=2042704 RepID=A0A2A4HPU6_9GAMM|nr:VTT domain-containing protein [Halomonas nigrificans]PCF96427.1 hypothetical protein CPA45_07840 [Halomonas nigrificans]
MITLSTFTAISKRLPYITSTMWARGFILSLLVVGLVVAGDRLAPHLPQMEAWVEAQGAWGPLYLIGFGMVLSVFCLPLDLLALAGGAVFGLPEAAVYVIAGLYLGQCLDYAIGRFFLGSRFLRWAETRPRLHRLREAIHKPQPSLLILLRATPLPASPIAYLMGATRIPYATFLIANLGMIPQAIVMTYVGYTAAHTTRLLHNSTHATLTHNILLYGGLAFAMIIVAIVAHRCRKLLFT